VKTVIVLFVVVLVLGSAISAARGEDPRKEYLRLQATEFCATVKRPPDTIAEALNNAVKQDPKTWMPAIVWWNAIAERYNELKCGST
jgi:hypothetical protein